MADFGQPDLPPGLTHAERAARLAAFRRAGGYDVLVVCGDREDAANIHGLTKFDPRFEQALRVVSPDRATLIAGHQCLTCTGLLPQVQAAGIRAVHCASLSLPSQPCEGRDLGSWLRALVPPGRKVGVVGWTWIGASEVDDPATVLDVGVLVGVPLRAIAGRVETAAALMMHAFTGPQARVDVARIARLEFALPEHMADLEAFQAAQIGGLPYRCHRSAGVSGAVGADGSGVAAGRADRVQYLPLGTQTFAGRVVSALPANARACLPVFVGPYLAAMSRRSGLRCGRHCRLLCSGSA